MKILAADNELPALNILVNSIIEAVPEAEIRSFSCINKILDCIKNNNFKPDVAFLDIEMPGMSGLELSKVLKKLCPNVNIVFITGFSQYALDALEQRPSGYVLKPATKEKILDELNNLSHPLKRLQPEREISIQCFSSFEIFCNKKPIQFLRSKSKELLAYLVDRRGASCSAAEVAAILWDDGIYNRSRQKQFSVIRADMIKSLKQVNADKIIVKSRDSLAVNTTLFDCDYYMALAGDVAAINSFTGEYMMPYSWAEYTTGMLVNKYEKFI